MEGVGGVWRLSGAEESGYCSINRRKGAFVASTQSQVSFCPSAYSLSPCLCQWHGNRQSSLWAREDDLGVARRRGGSNKVTSLAQLRLPR